MLDLENALASRHPQWLRGRRGRVARSLLRTLVRATRVEEIEGFIAARRHLTGFALVEATLEWLDCRYLIDQVELARVPESGPLLIVANHPLGALDALSLLHCIGRLRRDVRVVLRNRCLPDVWFRTVDAADRIASARAVHFRSASRVATSTGGGAAPPHCCVRPIHLKSA